MKYQAKIAATTYISGWTSRHFAAQHRDHDVGQEPAPTPLVML
jgi:hypothetical protein